MKNYNDFGPDGKKVIDRAANVVAKRYGTTRATRIVITDGKSEVTEYHVPHGISRTGIRAKLCAVKKWPKTYSYVPAECEVALNLRDAFGPSRIF